MVDFIKSNLIGTKRTTFNINKLKVDGTALTANRNLIMPDFDINLASILINQSNTITTANLNGVVGTLHLCTIAGLTASRDFILPTGSAGDLIGIYIVDGDVSFELLIKPSVTGTINGGAAGAEWSRLFIKGESLVLRCTAADTWIVARNGKIAMNGYIELTTSVTTNTANTFVYATSNSGVWTSRINVGSVVDASLGKIIMRRKCNAIGTTGIRTNSTITDGQYVNSGIEINDLTLLFTPFFVAGVTGLNGQISNTFPLVVATDGDYYRHKFRTQEANKGLQVSMHSYFHIMEVL
jgi:hypothetical protein